MKNKLFTLIFIAVLSLSLTQISSNDCDTYYPLNKGTSWTYQEFDKKAIRSNYRKLGIKFSVVGIKTVDYLTSNMRSMADLGGGEYVRILTVDDAKNKLFEEIKRTSYKPR